MLCAPQLHLFSLLGQLHIDAIQSTRIPFVSYTIDVCKQSHKMDVIVIKKSPSENFNIVTKAKQVVSVKCD